MIKNTQELIDNLSRDLSPVRPLRNPLIRTALWVAILLPYTGLVIIVLGFLLKRPIATLDRLFLMEQTFALATGITAAMAAFTSVIPGRNRSYLLWPVLPLIAWLGTLGESCLAAGPLAITGHNVWCFPFVIILGTAPAIVLWKMLRRGAPLTPNVTAGLGALAAAGVGNFCVRLIHQEDVTLMLLVWHVGGVFLLAILSGTAGRYLLNWRSLNRTS
jgi:hypothetical protein